jgi:hypothetical protein
MKNRVTAAHADEAVSEACESLAVECAEHVTADVARRRQLRERHDITFGASPYIHLQFLDQAQFGDLLDIADDDSLGSIRTAIENFLECYCEIARRMIGC